MHPRAIVFDFDGVVIESVRAKGEAFRRLFAEWPDHLDPIERFHYDNGGLSRYDKFTWIYRELLRAPLAAAEMAALDRRFGLLVADAVRTCPFVPGAREFIDRHAGMEPLFIASGTPEIELREIVADRGLARLFDGIYGAPREKAAMLAAIAAEIGAPPAELLFVGDGRQDYDAARQIGVPFVARVATGAPNRFPGSRMIVADLAELQERWAELAC